MGGQDFSDEQKRYLEGFVSGVQASRAAAGPQAAGGSGGGAASPQGRDAAHLKAMARVEAEGKKLAAEEKAKRDEHPFEAYARLKAESVCRASSPRVSTTSAGASTGCSTPRRRRTPSCAGCASPTAFSRIGSSPASPTPRSAMAAAMRT